jgi:dipeptidase E
MTRSQGRLLLVSNSTQHGRGYLDHCADAMRAFLGPARRVLFVPYAVADHAAYAARARERFASIGLALESLHDAPDGPIGAVERADALFVGGGNTFRLLDALWRLGLVEPIRRRGRSGMPYVGSSAGSNVACPTISTTNDMPIIEPPTFEALGLVPFNINPHYQDPLPGSTHMGETREQRIAEFHDVHAVPVVGLREGAWLTVEGREATLGGTTGARLFRRGLPPVEIACGSPLADLLAL